MIRVLHFVRAQIMRYELADHEWTAIKPMLPNEPRGVPRVNDRRVLNGIFSVLRSGAPWRDLPQAFLVRTRPATTGSLGDGGLVLRPHHRRACRSPRCGCPDDRHFDCSRASALSLHHEEPAPIDGKVTRRLDEQNSAVVDSNGLPVRLALSAGEDHYVRPAGCCLV
jgi:hypothetical protein